MDDVFQDEYPFGFIDGPLSLASLASTEIALTLWRYKCSARRNTTLSSVLNTNFSCTVFFSVPSRIKDIINEKITSVREELQKWVAFLLQSSDLHQSGFHDIDDVVFDSNGRISYSKTAAKAIKRANIDDQLKFKIACLFCLEDEIKQMWSSLYKNYNFNKLCLSDKSSPLFYWYCSMASSRDTTPIKNRIWKEFQRRNWASMSYFWRILKEELKVPIALKILKHNDIDAMMCLLPKLKEHQAQEVFEAKASEILSALISNQEYVEHVFALWTRMENVISRDEFLQVIRGLWNLTWNVSRKDCMRRYRTDGILMEIWSRAPDHLRSHVLNHSAEFFDGLQLQSPGFVFNYGHNMNFLLDLLRRNDAEFRKTIWQENWERIVLRAKIPYLKQFVELCLPDDESIDNFKFEEMPEFSLIQTLLIKHGLYSDLADYWNFCSKTPTLGKAMSRQMIKNNTRTAISTLTDCSNIAKFNLFVRGLFSDNESATKFKHELIWSWKGVKSLFVMFNKGRLNQCQQIISLFATSPENLEEMKCKFLDHSRKYLTSWQTNEFNVTQWNELLKWCTKNNDEIEAFKKSLNIDEIFEFMFTSYKVTSWNRRYRRYSGRLFFFDNFSDWYFDDEESKRAFKLEKMNRYNEGEAVRRLLTEDTPLMIRRMLNWAFENDEKEILRFRQRLVEDEVLTSVNPNEF